MNPSRFQKGRKNWERAADMREREREALSDVNPAKLALKSETKLYPLV